MLRLMANERNLPNGLVEVVRVDVKRAVLKVETLTQMIDPPQE